MKIRWDDEFLYIAGSLQDPDIWANVTKHDDVIYHDNDFEVFVDPAGSTHFYKEFEINAADTTWDLCLNRPYLNGGYENSSRTFPGAGWDMPAARTAVQVEGELGRPGPEWRRWTVEMALPIRDLMLNNTRRAPAAGRLWRINFSRVEWRVRYTDGVYSKTGGPEDNWVWAAMGAVNMHMPERWGYLQFAEGPVNGTAPRRDPYWTLRTVAYALYDAQLAYAAAHGGRYAGDVAALLPFAPPNLLDGTCTRPPVIGLSQDGKSYGAIVTSLTGALRAAIRFDRLFAPLSPALPLALPPGSPAPAVPAGAGGGVFPPLAPVPAPRRPPGAPLPPRRLP